MSLIAQVASNSVIRDNIGSLTQLIIPMTTLSTNDTYNLGTNLPVVNVDVQGDSTTTGVSNSGDATYSSTTGLVTIVSANQGPIILVVMMRN